MSVTLSISITALNRIHCSRVPSKNDSNHLFDCDTHLVYIFLKKTIGIGLDLGAGQLVKYHWIFSFSL